MSPSWAPLAPWRLPGASPPAPWRGSREGRRRPPCLQSATGIGTLALDVDRERRPRAPPARPTPPPPSTPLARLDLDRVYIPKGAAALSSLSPSHGALPAQRPEQWPWGPREELQELRRARRRPPVREAAGAPPSAIIFLSSTGGLVGGSSPHPRRRRRSPEARASHREIGYGDEWRRPATGRASAGHGNLRRCRWGLLREVEDDPEVVPTCHRDKSRGKIVYSVGLEKKNVKENH
jgi:hypothetical protein